MNNRVALLSILAVIPLLFAAPNADAAGDTDSPGVSGGAGVPPARWLVRAEGSLVAMRDNWLGLPAPEVGLTLGRDLTPRLSVELTGSGREVDSAHRSWSALAALRGVLAAN